MKFLYTQKFKKLYKKLPIAIKKKFEKQIHLLSHDTNHPSLNIKKIKGYPNIWEARIDYFYRFTFNWEKDTIVLRVIGAHDDVLGNP